MTTMPHVPVSYPPAAGLPVRHRSPAGRRRLTLACLAAVLSLVSGLVFVLPARAVPATLPFQVINNSGRSDVRLYVVGVDLDTNQLGYVDAGGAFHPWALPSAGSQVPAPDISINGPSAGAQVTLGIPRDVSGRVYFSYGAPLTFQLVSGGLVQPAPWSPSDPNAAVLFDWSEFTYSASGIWLNSSQVDQFAAPHEVTATGTDGQIQTAGAMVAGGRQRVIDTIRSLPDFARSVVTAADGSVLRVLAPGKATAAGLMSTTYLDPAIQAAWDRYRSDTLTVQPFGSGQAAYTGHTRGDQLVFTDASGDTVASFDRPSTADVWDCAGALAAPNDPVVGPIARTLCAALQRGTLATVRVQPAVDPSTFYRSAPANLYSAAIHANMADGLAYGFAFDDVGDQESLVHQSDPVSAGIVLGPLGSSSTPAATTAPPGPAPTTTSGPAPSMSEPSEPVAPSSTSTSVATSSLAVLAAGIGVQVDLPEQQSGYATLVLGDGTGPGLITTVVQGGSTSTAAVTGSGPVRVDLSGPPGPHTVTVTSTGPLGSVQVELP